MTKYLTKEEELMLGSRVQNMILAKQQMDFADELSTKEKAEFNRTILIGEDAVETLVKANQGLVYAKAQSFKSKYPGAPELEDLIQEGMAGLVHAIYRYDPKRNTKLSTSATHWIFQRINRSTNGTGRLVRLPENRVKDFQNISRLRAKYDALDVPRIDSDRLIMDELELSEQDLFSIDNAAATHTSLNKTVSDESGSKELIDFFADDNAVESSEAQVLKNTTHNLLMDKVNGLTEMQKEIVMSAFILDTVDSNALSAKDVREKYNISPAKFKKILSQSLELMKKDLSNLDMNYSDFMN